MLANNRPALRVGDLLLVHGCPSCPPHPRKMAKGSASVLINGKPACRVDDAVDCGGVLITGSANVVIGEYQGNDDGQNTGDEKHPSEKTDQIQTLALSDSLLCERCGQKK